MRAPLTGDVVHAGNECPIDGCNGRRERSHHVMCRACWRLVGPSLQSRVWGTLSERNRVAAGRPTREQLRRAVDAHEEVRARAIRAAQYAIRHRRAAA